MVVGTNVIRYMQYLDKYLKHSKSYYDLSVSYRMYYGHKTDYNHRTKMQLGLKALEFK